MKTGIHPSVYEELFKRKPRIIGYKIRRDGEFYIGASSYDGTLFSLNTLAGQICMYCDGNRTVEEIYKELIVKYTDTDRDMIAFDLCKCLSDLEAVGMITVTNSNAS